MTHPQLLLYSLSDLIYGSWETCEVAAHQALAEVELAESYSVFFLYRRFWLIVVYYNASELKPCSAS